MPEGDDDFRVVGSVFTHELTHHWMDLCCPAFSDSQRAQGAGSKAGYWIEEAFAMFLEEARFDVRSRTWDLDDPVAGSVDTVANAAPGQLLSWDAVFQAGYPEFKRLDRVSHTVEIPMRWRLGFRRKTTESNLFYDQAACACRYLYVADGGAYRSKLLDFVAVFHSSGAKADTLSTSLGMSYGELGAQVVAWAKARQRPPGK